MNAFGFQDIKTRQSNAWFRWVQLLVFFGAIAGIFILRTWLAHSGNPPRLFTLFNSITIIASLFFIAGGARHLRRSDWLLALLAGVLLGGLVTFTGFYPLIEFPGPVLTSLAHGAGLAAVLCAGIVIMRQGGPVAFRLALGERPQAVRSIFYGILVGLPFAALNAFAFSMLQGRPFDWQNPLAAALGALQPAIVEEAAYRFAFLGMVWWLFRKTWPERAILIAAAACLLVHNYAHLDGMFRDSPLMALGYGAVLGLIWGLPEVLLAVRRDLEASMGFHWIQDFLRFLTGF